MRLYFKIYYADGSTRQGKTFDDWQSLPSEGVLVVVEIYDRVYGHPPKYAGRRVAYVDYYWMTPDEKISGGPANLIPQDALTKAGTLVERALWENIYNLASVDPPYGNKD